MAEDPPIEPATEEQPAKPTLWQRAKVRALKTLILFVLGPAVLVLAVVLGLDTGPGHRFVANQIAGLTFQNGMRISVGRIDGSLYGKMTLRDLSVRDTKGEFLFSPAIEVDWRPFAYLDNHVDVRSAIAKRMVLRRVPALKKTPPSNEPLLPNIDVDVGVLRIDRFISEPAVTGKQRIVTIDGSAHIADGRALVKAKGATIAIKGKDGGDSFTFALDALPAKNRLGLDLDLNAPADGLIAALGGFKQPLRLNLSGKGDWANWNGTLNADFGKGELARLVLTGRAGTFAIQGKTHASQLFTGSTARLLGPVTNVDLTAALANRRATLSGLISSEAFDFSPNGVVDLSDNSFGKLQLAFEVLKPTALAENLSGAGLRVLATLDGPFAHPTVDYRISAKRVVMNDVGLENLSASGVAKVSADHTTVPVSAKVERITGLDTVAGGRLDNVSLNGDLAIKGPRILSDNMRLSSRRLNAGLTLIADVSKGFYTGAIDGRIDNYRLASVGIFNIQSNMDLKSEANAFALQGTVKAQSTKLLNDSVRSYLGGNFATSARVHYGSDGVVRFSQLRLTAPDLRVANGKGSWSPDGHIALSADGTSQRYGAIGLHVAGTIKDPNAHLTAERPGLGIGLANLDARLEGASGGYRFAATGDTDYGPLKADVTLGTGKTASVTINSASLSQIMFTGKLVQTPAGPFAGELTANGNGVGGVLNLDAEGHYQAINFNLRANNAVFDGPARLSIGSAIINGRAVLYDQPTLVADAQLSGSHLGSFDLAAGRVLVDYRKGQGKAKGLIEGVSGVPFRMAFNADLAPKLWRVALQGRMRGQTIKTTSPARIVPGPNGYELLPTTISVGGGTMKLAGTYGTGIKLQSRLEGVDMTFANAFMPGYGLDGTASGSLDFEQATPTAFPIANARLTLNNFTRTSATTVSQPVDVDVVGKLLPDGGEARAVIRRRGSVIGRFAADLRPLPPGAGSWTERLLQAPLSGGVRYNGPADTLFSFAGQAGQSLSGAIGVAADFSCHLTDPCLNGVVKGKGLTYENQAYGTRLSSMDLSGKFNGSSFELTSLTAKAGSGTVSASGKVNLAAADGYPMDISAKLDHAQLAKSEALSATASGTLHLTKTAGEPALLSGELKLPETRYQIVREGAAQIPQLTGVHFKPTKGPTRITGDEQASEFASAFALVRLDLTLKAPDKLYVSGMGLESEWGANFHLTGTSAAPIMTGQVSIVRGTLSFAGHAFEIDNGQITFTGGDLFDPTVAISASDSIEDVDVSVNVAGQATNPKISFSSSPSLPDDEVLSRILFGSSVANLSAIQAVQLASSLNSLRGTGGGLNPLGKLRSATGIDRLRILAPDATTGRGTSLAAGQYITNNIYVELITDARGFTATQLEVSITKWLSVLSQAGGSGVNSVNVRIKKNY